MYELLKTNESARYHKAPGSSSNVVCLNEAGAIYIQNRLYIVPLCVCHTVW